MIPPMEIVHPFDEDNQDQLHQSYQRLKILWEGRYLHQAQARETYSKLAPFTDYSNPAISMDESDDKHERMQYYVLPSSPNTESTHDDHQGRRYSSLHLGIEKTDNLDCHSAGCSSPASSFKSAADAPVSPCASDILSRSPMTQSLNRLSIDEAGCSSPASSLKSAGDAPVSPCTSDIPRSASYVTQPSNRLSIDAAGYSSPTSSLKSAGEASVSPCASDIPRSPSYATQQSNRLSIDVGISSRDSLPASPRSYSSSQHGEDVCMYEDRDVEDKPLNLSVLKRVNVDKETQSSVDSESTDELKCKLYSRCSSQGSDTATQVDNMLTIPSILITPAESRHDDNATNNDSNVEIKPYRQNVVIESDNKARKMAVEIDKDAKEYNLFEEENKSSSPAVADKTEMKFIQSAEILKKLAERLEEQKHKLNPTNDPSQKQKKPKNTTKNHKCNYCGKTFALPWKLKIHIRVHTGEKPYQCHVCGKRFSVRCNLRDHIQLHTGNRPWKCSQCPAKFSWPSQLKAHGRVHSGEKPYKCQYCSMAFAWSSSKTHHERGHRGDKKHQCNLCSSTFVKKYLLQDHLRVHYETNQIICKYCHKVFMDKESFQEHEQSHAVELLNTCCGETFQTARSLRKHQSVVHNPEFPYICQRCFIKFRTVYDLKEHNKIVHRCITTDEENFKLSNSRNFQDRGFSLDSKQGRSEDSNTILNINTNIVDDRVNSELYNHEREQGRDKTGAFSNTIKDFAQNLSQKLHCHLEEEFQVTKIPQNPSSQSNLPQESEKPLDFSGTGKVNRNTSLSGSTSPNALPLSPKLNVGLDLRKFTGDDKYLPEEKQSAFRNVRQQYDGYDNHYGEFVHMGTTTHSAVAEKRRFSRLMNRKDPYPTLFQTIAERGKYLSSYERSGQITHSPTHDKVFAEYLSKCNTTEKSLISERSSSVPAGESISPEHYINAPFQSRTETKYRLRFPSTETNLPDRVRYPLPQRPEHHPSRRSPTDYLSNEISYDHGGRIQQDYYTELLKRTSPRDLPEHILDRSSDDKTHGEHFPRSPKHLLEPAYREYLSHSPSHYPSSGDYILPHSPSHDNVPAEYISNSTAYKGPLFVPHTINGRVSAHPRASPTHTRAQAEYLSRSPSPSQEKTLSRRFSSSRSHDFQKSPLYHNTEGRHHLISSNFERADNPSQSPEHLGQDRMVEEHISYPSNNERDHSDLYQRPHSLSDQALGELLSNLPHHKRDLTYDRALLHLSNLPREKKEKTLVKLLMEEPKIDRIPRDYSYPKHVLDGAFGGVGPEESKQIYLPPTPITCSSS